MFRKISACFFHNLTRAKYQKERTLSHKEDETVELVKKVDENNKLYVRKIWKVNPDEIKLNIKALKLCNPYVVKYLETETEKDHYELIVKYFVRGNLKDILDKSKQMGRILSKNTVHGIFTQLCLALDFFHSHHIVHRGVRITNFFFEEDGKLALGGDGELIGVKENGEHVDKSVTKTTVGTVFNGAPEELEGVKPSYSSDVYRLGVIIYLITSGVYPFSPESGIITLKKIKKGKYNPYVPLMDYDNELERLMLAMMSTNPKDRPRTSDLVKEQLVVDTLERLRRVSAYAPQNVEGEIPQFFTVGFVFPPAKQAEILAEIESLKFETREQCKAIFTVKASFLVSVFSEADDEDGGVTLAALKKLLEIVLTLCEGSNRAEDIARLEHIESLTDKEKNLLYYLHHFKREVTQVHVALVYAALMLHEDIEKMVVALPQLARALSSPIHMNASSSSPFSSSSSLSSSSRFPSPLLQSVEIDAVLVNSALRIVDRLSRKRENLECMKVNWIVKQVQALGALTDERFVSASQRAKALLTLWREESVPQPRSLSTVVAHTPPQPAPKAPPPPKKIQTKVAPSGVFNVERELPDFTILKEIVPNIIFLVREKETGKESVARIIFVDDNVNTKLLFAIERCPYLVACNQVHILNNNRQCMIMENCTGGNLAGRIAEKRGSGGYFTEDEVCKIIVHIGGALAFLHTKKIVHRDVKPENILISKEEIYKLGDFGNSTQLNRSLSRRKTTVGTDGYIAPEVYCGETYDVSADVYSFGLVLFEVMTLRNAYFVVGEDENANFSMKKAVTADTAPLVSAFRYSDALLDIVKEILIKNPSKRITMAQIMEKGLITDYKKAKGL